MKNYTVQKAMLNRRNVSFDFCVEIKSLTSKFISYYFVLLYTQLELNYVLSSKFKTTAD